MARSKKSKRSKSLLKSRKLSSLRLNFPLQGIVKKEDEQRILNTMATAVMNVLGLNLQQNVSFEEPIDVLNRNALEIVSIPKDTQTSELVLNTISEYSDIQTLTVPFDDEFVEQLITCPKVEIKSEKIYSGNNREDSLVEEERILLIGKIGDSYIPFQFNIRKGQPTKRDLYFSTSLCVILNGREYTILERYDSKKGHTNIMLDRNLRQAREKQDLQMSTTPHLHVHKQKVMLTLFNAVLGKGFSPRDVLQSKIMSRQDAASYQSFRNQQAAKNYFCSKYSIIPASKRSVDDTIENVFEMNKGRLKAIQYKRSLNASEEFANQPNKQSKNQNQNQNQNHKKKNKDGNKNRSNVSANKDTPEEIRRKQEERKRKKEKTKNKNDYKGKSKGKIDSEFDF